MIAAFEFYDEEKSGYMSVDLFRHCMQDLGPDLDFD
jgi:Ca2+-binding EF-hand superfamily protein